MAIFNPIPGTGERVPIISPDYTPPSFLYKDANEILIPNGRYQKAGYRFSQQYRDLANINSYWDVAGQFAVDVDSAGVMVGGKANSSWYSVFMLSESSVILLPFVRVDSISYSSPSTTINPAAHNDGTTAENGFVSAADVFNDYRLLPLNDDPTENGNVYTIADCTDGTPDTIVITGDITADVAATEWLQMIPPSGTACLYLGCIHLDSSGNIDSFIKKGWHYTWTNGQKVVAAVKGTTPGNTDMGAAFPPTAINAAVVCHAEAWAVTSQGLLLYLYAGSSGTNVVKFKYFRTSEGENDRILYEPMESPITAVGIIRNMNQYYNGSAWVGATSANLRIGEFDE